MVIILFDIEIIVKERKTFFDITDFESEIKVN